MICLFSRAARHLVGKDLASRESIAANSVNFGDMAMQFGRNRTFKHNAALKAQASVLGDVAKAKAKVEGTKTLLDAKASARSTNRMAGILAAGVGAIGLAVQPDEKDSYGDLFQQQTEKMNQLVSEREARLTTKRDTADTYMPGRADPTKRC